MKDALTVRSFGRHAVLAEMPIAGPHALRDYCRNDHATVTLTRYSPAGRRLTHRGAVLATFTDARGTSATVQIVARRTPQPLPLWPVYELRDGHPRTYGAAADPIAAAAMARACVEDGASVAEVMSPAGDVALVVTPDMLTDDDWTPAATIDPEDDGAYHELAPMPTPRLHLEPQPVPLTQATFV